MESPKFNKETNKKSINIPTAIRFNVDEESLEDVNEPSQNVDTSVNNTWQLIKGKVSQAMEDIKSSSNKAELNDEFDSQKNASIRDQLSLDLATENTTASSNANSTKSSPQKLFNFGRSKTPRNDETLEEELSSLRKSFQSNFNLRFKTKKMNTNVPTTSEKSEKPEKLSSSLSNSFLRKRKPATKIEPSAGTGSTSKPLQPEEVESGVEMFEDMVLPSTKTCKPEKLLSEIDCQSTLNSSSDEPIISDNKKTERILDSVPNFFLEIKKLLTLEFIKEKLRKFLFNFHALLTLSILFFILLVEISDFLLGMLTCVLGVILINLILESLSEWLKNILYSNTNGNRVEKSEFQIPEYSKSQILQIPIEEQKMFKSYSGWMHEINSYDPSNHHIPSVPIYLQLEGSKLTLSNTTARISKRLMWSEKKIDKNNTTFTYHRCFDLTGCRIDMLPKGLARKRYFNRKYPMQLIIKSSTKKHHHKKKINEQEAPSSKTLKNEIHSNEETNLNIDNNLLNDNDRKSLDIGSKLLELDVHKIDNKPKPSLKEGGPSSDETRILFFARCDREKEDWYRRFKAASEGMILDEKPKLVDFDFILDEDIDGKGRSDSLEIEDNFNYSQSVSSSKNVPKEKNLNSNNKDSNLSDDSEGFEQISLKREASPVTEVGNTGFVICASSFRNPPEYIRFMSRYLNKRQKSHEDELWKGIDQQRFLGPFGSEIWANVFIGRILFSCLTEKILLEKIQDFLQKKLSAIKLPGFMEDVSIENIHLGESPPLIHRFSQPISNERGVWIDADVTYEGLMHMTITTKLNLLRLKRGHHYNRPSSIVLNDDTVIQDFSSNLSSTENPGSEKKYSSEKIEDSQIVFKNHNDLDESLLINAAIFDSDAESSGASESESSSPTHTSVYYGTATAEISDLQAPGSSRKLLRIVDRITDSKLFQSATELSYVQRAMENMSTKLALRVDLRGLVSRVVINIPPPSTDRIWISFRGPPRLWITAKPAVGEHQFDWSIITNVIENKLYDEVCKYLVYPNMIDIILPFLGESTYKEN